MKCAQRGAMRKEVACRRLSGFPAAQAGSELLHDTVGMTQGGMPYGLEHLVAHLGVAVVEPRQVAPRLLSPSLILCIVVVHVS